jgi:DoxX-like family
MNAMNVLNLVLWGVQGFLALFFLASGAPKLIGRGLERWTGFSDLPRAQVVFTGIMEVLGAAGLILPMATGILPWLTPLAAVGLAIIVLMASGFHQRANERLPALEQAVIDTPVTGADQTPSEQHRCERAGPAQTSRACTGRRSGQEARDAARAAPAQALHVLGRIRSL